MPNFKKISLATTVIVLALIAGICWHHFSFIRSSHGNEIKTVTFGDIHIQAEVVSSQQKMETGLGGRDSLCKTCGMYFAFPKAGIYSIWMKDMRFPLDIIWIAGGKIMHIEKNVQPDFAGILTPSENADSVLEINAGITEKSDLQVGDGIVYGK